MMEQKPERIVTPADGAEPLAALRARFKPRGLIDVIKAARAAEGPIVGELQQSEATLRLQLAATEPASTARLSLERQLGDVCRCLGEQTRLAADRSHRVFISDESQKLLRDDLVRLVAFLEDAKKSIVKAQQDHARLEGWTPPTEANVARTNSYFVAVEEFIERHVRGLAEKAEFRVNGGEEHVDVGAASWAIAGCGWRGLEVSK